MKSLIDVDLYEVLLASRLIYREVAHLLNKQRDDIRRLEAEIRGFVEENKNLKSKCSELERAMNSAVREKLEQLKIIEVSHYISSA